MAADMERALSEPNPESPEISEQLLSQVVPGVLIFAGDELAVHTEYEATVADIREALRPLGLEITTQPVNWSKQYPGHESAEARLLALQQELADLQQQLGAR